MTEKKSDTDNGVSALRQAVQDRDAARDRLFSDGLDDDELAEAGKAYAEAVAAHDKALSSA